MLAKVRNIRVPTHLRKHGCNSGPQPANRGILYYVLFVQVPCNRLAEHVQASAYIVGKIS